MAVIAINVLVLSFAKCVNATTAPSIPPMAVTHNKPFATSDVFIEPAIFTTTTNAAMAADIANNVTAIVFVLEPANFVTAIMLSNNSINTETTINPFFISLLSINANDFITDTNNRKATATASIATPALAALFPAFPAATNIKATDPNSKIKLPILSIIFLLSKSAILSIVFIIILKATAIANTPNAEPFFNVDAAKITPDKVATINAKFFKPSPSTFTSSSFFNAVIIILTATAIESTVIAPFVALSPLALIAIIIAVSDKSMVPRTNILCSIPSILTPSSAFNAATIINRDVLNPNIVDANFVSFPADTLSIIAVRTKIPPAKAPSIIAEFLTFS